MGILTRYEKLGGSKVEHYLRILEEISIKREQIILNLALGSHSDGYVAGEQQSKLFPRVFHSLHYFSSFSVCVFFLHFSFTSCICKNSKRYRKIAMRRIYRARLRRLKHSLFFLACAMRSFSKGFCNTLFRLECLTLSAKRKLGIKMNARKGNPHRKKLVVLREKEKNV